MAKTYSGPNMDVTNDGLRAKSAVYTQTSITASSSQREDCKSETAPLQRLAITCSFLLQLCALTLPPHSSLLTPNTTTGQAAGI